ncbi:LysR family transcriptional regulator [Phyllobacterium myrsinacearum]|uniref:DNA-binding transcriptional LysR family regulator n=1 Tax=Phyllobacterium myrsinacearum TaxID=28101 RepID=A0A839EXC4_9HYPH|nr:LysR family transcriptional regulator [Phyllobacterium myrsinacearum]MBA8881037.1 DNA-binding transcriptional LysR family regulator [Phyllobacterium myrsinacearum]
MDMISALQTFLRVAETGSFSVAASERHLTQPAVSRKITALEQHFDTRLLHRTTSGVALTVEGERLVPLALRIIDLFDELGDSVGTASTHASGHVRISVPTPLGLYLSERIGDLLGSHPDLSLDLIFNEGTSDLISERLDLEVRLGTPADSSLICRRIGWTTAFLVASPSYVAHRSPLQKLSDIHGHDCISYGRVGDGYVWHFSTGAEDVCMNIAPKMLANNALGVHRAAVAGAGLAVLSHIIAAPDITAGRLVNLLPAYPPTRFPIYVVYPSRRNIPLRVRTVLDFLTAAVREDPLMNGVSTVD